MDNDKNWNELADLIIQSSKELDAKTPIQKLLKLVEEVGELSQAFLIHTDASGTKHRNKNEYSVLEELADCLICIISLVEVLNLDLNSFKSMIDKKIIKWKNKLNIEKESK